MSVRPTSRRRSFRRAYDRLAAATDRFATNRRLRVLFVSFVTLGCAVATTAAEGASAAPLVNGAVTVTTIGTVTANSPFSSGQSINIAVAANTTLDAASVNAANAGGQITIEECVAVNGVAPTTPDSNCDGLTSQVTSNLNADGSFTYSDTVGGGPYTVYALPDTVKLFESRAHVPACGLAPNWCILYIGVAPLDFSKPHLFSAPFVVQPNATDSGANPGDGTPLPQSSTSATLSTVTAAPSTAIADGVDSSKITVTLKDTNGAVVTGGKTVTISQGSGHSVVTVGTTSTSTTTSDPTTGQASFTVSDFSAESVTYTIVADGVTLATKPSVAFSAPTVAVSNSTVVASPTAVALGSSATVTVTLLDQGTSPQPVVGKTVQLTAASGHSLISPTTGVTDARGTATFTVSDSSNESVTYTAVDTTDSTPLTGKSASVTFGTVGASAAASTVTASPSTVNTIAIGGTQPTGTVTVTLLGADGTTPIAGKTITLSSPSTHVVIVPAATPNVTDANGRATFTVSDTTAETVIFSAQDSSDAISLSQTAQVDFQTSSVSITNSTIKASTTLDHADGVTPDPITVQLVDQFGQPLAGKAITITAAPSGTARVAPQTVSSAVPAGTTDANGYATFEAYDTTAEVVTYTVVDTTDNVTLSSTLQITFVPGLPQVNNSSLTASPSSVPADGSTASTVTVSLQDHNGNPVPGKLVAISAGGGSSAIASIGATTNSSGQATFSVVDNVAEQVTYSATDVTDSLPLAGEQVAVTFGSPPPVGPSIPFSTLVESAPNVSADGNSAIAVVVILSDGNGIPLSGRTVSLVASAGSSAITPVNNGLTDANGAALFYVRDAVSESVTYTATDATDNVAITGHSVAVTFTDVNGGAYSSPSAIVITHAKASTANRSSAKSTKARHATHAIASTHRTTRKVSTWAGSAKTTRRNASPRRHSPRQGAALPPPISSAGAARPAASSTMTR